MCEGRVNVNRRLHLVDSSGMLHSEVIADVCASVQLAVTRLLCRRLQRAIEYCALKSLLNLPLPITKWPPRKLDNEEDPSKENIKSAVVSHLFGFLVELIKIMQADFFYT